MNYRILFYCACLVATGFGLYLSKTTHLSPTSKNITLGVVSGYAPFVSTNATGQLEGFDIDVAYALAQAMVKDLIVKEYGSMTSLLLALDQGTIDAAIWGLSITEERLKKLTMIHYHGQNITAYPLIFWQTPTKEIKTFQDLTNLIICAEPGSTQNALLERYITTIPFTILPTEKIDDALLAIQFGKADAAFVEPAIAKKFKTKFPSITIVNLPLALTDQEHGIGIALKKNNEKLKKMFESGIQQLRVNGLLEAYEEKWNMV